MKRKIALTLIAISLLIAPNLTQAQVLMTEELRAQIIELILEQIRILQIQLEEQLAIELKTQVKDEVRSEIQKLTPAPAPMPTAQLPELSLQAQAARTIDPNKGKYQNIYSQAGAITIEVTDRIPDKLEILVNFKGGQDFVCQKFGAWSGDVSNEDQWLPVENPRTGTYGIRCSIPDGTTVEQQIEVTVI